MRKFLVCVIVFSMFAGLQIGKKVTAEELLSQIEFRS